MKRARALVADDNLDLRDVLSYILERFEIDIVTVTCGELLSSLALDASFDVIVTDVGTPWSGCARVLHAARSVGASCPVILMTTSGMTHEQIAALGPAVQVLQKPFSLAQLEAALLVALVDRPREPLWCAPPGTGSHIGGPPVEPSALARRARCL